MPNFIHKWLLNSHLATSWDDNWYKIDFYSLNTRFWSHLDEFNPYFWFQIILKRILHKLKTALFLAKIELILNFKTCIKKINIGPNIRNIVVNEEIAKNLISYQEGSQYSYTVQTKFTLKMNVFSGRKCLSFITQSICCYE